MSNIIPRFQGNTRTDLTATSPGQAKACSISAGWPCSATEQPHGENNPTPNRVNLG